MRSNHDKNTTTKSNNFILVIVLILVLAIFMIMGMQYRNAIDKAITAIELTHSGNFLEAIDTVNQIPNDAPLLYNKKDKKLSKIKQDLLKQYIQKAQNMIRNGEYVAANEIGNKLQEYYSNNSDVLNIIFSTTNIVEFNGAVQHIFFKPLIAYPDRAFSENSTSQDQADYMTTVLEFKEALRQLYENDYILIDARTMFNLTLDEKGAVIKLSKRPIMIPEGKKPIIISVDDICYYDYMKDDGRVFKLVLDKDGNVATYSKDMDGKDVISKDNEVIPILDEFVKEHPNFSMNNAKGCLAVTSFNGILGYETGPSDNSLFEKGNKEVMPIIERLKETGWYFASHGDGPNQPIDMSNELFKKDMDLFLKSTKHLIGYTPLYMYSYGEEMEFDSEKDNEKFEYAKSKGFAMFCGVGDSMFQEYGQDYIFQKRRSVDGIAMKDKRLYDLFDISKLVDPVRSWYKDQLNVWVNEKYKN